MADKKAISQEEYKTKSFSGAIPRPKEIDLLKKELAEINDRQKQLDAKLERSQSTSVEILGLFVALFTFVSIEFQLTRTFDYFEFLGISLLFAGLLSFFVLILHTIISKDLNCKILLFLLFSILFILLASYQFTSQRGVLNSTKINTERVGPQLP